jgi:hypothetical protein
MVVEKFIVNWYGRHPKHPEREILHHTPVLSSSQAAAQNYIQEIKGATYLRPGGPLCGCDSKNCNVAPEYHKQEVP